MKFGEKLVMSIEPQWADAYMQYARLKALLKRAEQALARTLGARQAALEGRDDGGAGGPGAPELLAAFKQADDAFFELVEADILAVDAFYRERLAHYSEALRILGGQLAPICAGGPQHRAKPAKKAGEKGASKRAAPPAEGVLSEAAIAGLKQAMVGTYRSLQKLRGYGIVNYSGFVKIFKKYRKRAYGPRLQAVGEAAREERAQAARAAGRFVTRQGSGGAALLRGLLGAGPRAPPPPSRAHSLAAVGARSSAAVGAPRPLSRWLSAGRVGAEVTTPLLPLGEQHEPREPGGGARADRAPARAGCARARASTGGAFAPGGSLAAQLAQLATQREEARAGEAEAAEADAHADAAPDGADLEAGAPLGLGARRASAPHAALGPPPGAPRSSPPRVPASASAPRRPSGSAGALGLGVGCTSLDLAALFASRTGAAAFPAEPLSLLPDPTAPYLEALRTCSFGGFGALDALIAALEGSFAAAFCDGDVHLARSALLVRRSREWASWRQLQRGLKMGGCLGLLLWLLWDCAVDAPPDDAEGRAAMAAWSVSALPLYRGCALLALSLWVAAVCVGAWSRCRINFAYLLDEPALPLTSGPYIDLAANLTLPLLLSCLLSLKAARGMLPPSSLNPGLFPAASLLSLPATLLLPPSRGKPLLRLLGRVLCGPFAECTFLLAFAADILTSLVRPMADLAHAACYVGTGEALLPLAAQGGCASSRLLRSGVVPLLLAGPTFLRLCQNLRKYCDSRQRHPSLSNAAKYLMSLSVSLVGAFHREMASVSLPAFMPAVQIAWLSLYAASSLYAFCWDVTVDWGLGERARALPPANALLAEAAGDEAAPAESSAATSCSLARARGLRSAAPAAAPARPPAHALAERRVACGLREHLLYGHPPLYYAAIGADLFGRFVFIYTLVPVGAGLGGGQLGGGFALTERVFAAVGPFVAAIEVLRRGMWSLFRLENQQLGRGPDRAGATESIPLHFDKAADPAGRREPDDDEAGPRAALIEVSAFLAVAGAVLVFAVATRTD